MKFTTAAALTALLGTAAAAKDKRTFAVLHFTNKQLTIARADPIVNPGGPSTHVHHILGGSNFGISSTGEELIKSNCSTAKVKGDNSNYWFPSLYFKDPKTGVLESVELFYANVYYFFEPTNDDIKAFPVGLQMFNGDPETRLPPAAGAESNMDPSKGPINAIKWTCPRKDMNKPAWVPGSNGLMAGIGDRINKGEGVGFPDVDCDGFASPLRADIHFPSCYDKSKGLTDYKNNMYWPEDNNGKQDCRKGDIHVPHIFFEAYWNTPKFSDRWEQGKGTQPFVLSNGDPTGYSLHGDFMAGWDEKLLQHVIDTCDTGTSGMENCAGLFYGQNEDHCTIESPIKEQVTGTMSQLPGDVKITGWGYGGGDENPREPLSSSQSPAQPSQSSSQSPAQPSSSSQSPAQPSQSSSQSAAQPPKSSSESSAASNPTSEAGSSEEYPTTTGQPASSATSSEAAETQTGTSSSRTLSAAPTGTSDDCKPVKTHTVTNIVTVTGTASPPTTTGSAGTGDVAGFKYAGCFKDGQSRALNGKIRPNIGRMSNEKCVKACKDLNFSVAGTEYGGQCYCGNEIFGSERLDESACNVACEDDAGSKCGGSWALSVYSAAGEVSMKNAQRRRHMHDHMHRRSAHF